MVSWESVVLNRSPKVLVIDPSTPKHGIRLLQQKGCDVIQLEKKCEEEVLKHIAGVDALLWAPPIILNKKMLDAAGPNMKTVATLSVGYNHIDIDELKKRGVKLANTSGTTAAVVDIAILLALSAARRLHDGRLKIERGEWDPHNLQFLFGQDLGNSTVGIIGFGGIGQGVARRLKGFEVRQILYAGPKEKKEGKDLGAKFVPLDILLKESDFVIVCVPLTKETQSMCNKEFFSKMKKTAVFVNVGRGAVVDQPALITALKKGDIFAAGLDVVTPEPLPADHELLQLPNVVITPHLGSSTINTRKEISELAAKNILQGLAGEDMITRIV
ncbi:unnamed protein product [Acanthoscelides obtectus]|nr:unnamed protein product [Acanthoscelides obtectus]CAK1662154.1 Glyoxylate reductase/hydroxypyruvate reductase [Acanthoscelides obtectus]